MKPGAKKRRVSFFPIEHLSYFYIMDIQQLILDTLALSDFEIKGKSKEELDDLKQHYLELDARIKEFSEQVGRLQIMSYNFGRDVDLEKNKLIKDENEIKAKKLGYEVGTYHYIDRHVGFYRVIEVNYGLIEFEQIKDGNAWHPKKKFRIDKIDPRMEPLRTKGPYKVGDKVMRENKEYEVIGYLGYRMVLKSFNNFGQEIFNTVQKDDEKTYRSLII